ncbi:hypothetical protein [Anaerosporobacter sp.]
MAVVHNYKSKSISRMKKEEAIIFRKCERLKEGQEYIAEVKSLTAKGENAFLVVKPFKRLADGAKKFYASATAMLEGDYETGSLTEQLIYALGEVEDAHEYVGKEILIKIEINKKDGKTYNNISEIQPIEEENPLKSKRATVSILKSEEEDVDEEEELEDEDEEDLYEDEDDE